MNKSGWNLEHIWSGFNFKFIVLNRTSYSVIRSNNIVCTPHDTEYMRNPFAKN